MKFRKVVLLFLILSFGVIIEGITVTRNVLNDESFEGFGRAGGRLGRGLRDLQIDGFPFSRDSRFRGPSVDFTESQTTEALGITAIEISNEFGDVTIRRTSDPKAQIGIGLRKEIFTRRPEGAESISGKVKLEVNRAGDTLKISTSRAAAGESRVKTHIEIDTPMPLDTRITNRYGTITVEGARAVNVSGEFGDVRLTDVTGDCVAKNRHGKLEVISAAQGCRVDVEFGEVHVEKLLSNSRVDVSHGSLNALDLAGLTTNLKFSDLQAQKIGGNLDAQGEHADLRIDDVKGNVTLNNQGDIDIQNILGRVSIENRRGHVRLLKAASAVMIKNAFDSVAASDVGGVLEITNEHGTIRAHRFLKGGRLETDSEDIDAFDFEGPLRIEVQRGDVSLKPMRKVTSPLDIQVDIGDVTLGLPDSINAGLDASVERGEVEGNVGALKSSEQGKRLLRATIGAGGPLLKLRSRLGDIKVSDSDDVDVAEPDSPDAPEIDARFRMPLGADPRPVAPKAPVVPEIAKAHEAPKAPKAPEVPEPEAKPTPDHR